MGTTRVNLLAPGFPLPGQHVIMAPVSRPIDQMLLNDFHKAITRRYFFRECSIGLGAMALATLLRDNGLCASAARAAVNPLAPRAPHFAPKAKRVIYLFQAGGPSQLDLFDYKTALLKYEGKPVPAEVV